MSLARNTLAALAALTLARGVSLLVPGVTSRSDFRRAIARTVPLLCGAALLAPVAAEAAERRVTKTADTNDGQCTVADCSLREAVGAAIGTDVVVVPAGTYSLTLGELALHAAGTIQGAGAGATTITAGFSSRVLTVSGRTPGPVTVSGVTITGGSSKTLSGAGIFAPNSPLIVTDSVIRDNFATGAGGGIYADSLTLTRSTVSGNTVSGGTVGGGGVYANLRGLNVVDSTVSGNSASLLPPDGASAGGGGIHYAGRLASIRNSTISGNTLTFSGPPVASGGGGYFGGNGADAFQNVTVAGNSSASAPGGGLFTPSGVPVRLQNTMVAGNTAPSGSGCGGGAFGSLGNNLEFPGNTCNLTAAGDKPNTNPALGPLAANGGPTPTHALLPGSPAIDAAAASACPPADQRGVARPQGAVCDIGAYEWVAVAQAAPPDTTIAAGPPAVTRDRTPVFTFSSNVPGATFECSVDGGPFTPCSSPFVTSRALGAGRHSFAVRARDPGGNVDPTPATFVFAIPAVLSDLPPPVLGRTVNAEPIAGEVTVAVPAGASSAGKARASQKGLRYIPLREARQLPVGTHFNTRKGRVRLRTATTRRGQTQTGDFSSGIFQTLQSARRSARGLTELRLKGSSFRSCGRAGHSRKAAAARHSKRRVRRLRGNARGRFRTRGRYSAATVRGTVWEVADRCDGTLTKVTRGRVAVRDFRRRKTILVRAGKSYLARARR